MAATLQGSTVGLKPFPPGTTYAQAAAQFDARAARTMALAGQKIYLNEGTFPADITSNAGISMLHAKGAAMLISVKPSRTLAASQQTALGAFLDMLLASGFSPSNCWVTLWQEANDSTKSGFTPADYQGYVSFYGPTVRSRFPLYYDPSQGGQTNAQILAYYTTGAFDGICVDFYSSAYKRGLRVDFLQAQANTDGIPFGIGEWGVTALSTYPDVTNWNAYISYLTTLLAAQQATPQGCPFVFYWHGFQVYPAVGSNQIVPSSGTTYDKVPGMQSMYDTLAAGPPQPPTTSAAFTFVQTSAGTQTGSGGVIAFGLPAPVTQNSLLVAHIQSADGSQTITPPNANWHLTAEDKSGTGTSGVARAQQWRRVNAAGGFFGPGASNSTTVDTPSNGGTIANIATWANPSAGVLAAASMPGPLSGGSGYLAVVTSGTLGIINYTGTNGNTFTGCTFISGTGTIATGAGVFPPAVFTYSNTAAGMRGSLDEYSVPAGNTVTPDRQGTGHGTGNITSFPVTASAADTYTNELGIITYGVNYSSAPSGQSLTNPAGYTLTARQLNVVNELASFYQTGLAAGTATGTSTLSPAPTTENGWAGVIATFYAVSSSGNLPVINTPSVPPGTAGVAGYTYTFTETGGQSPFTWSSAGTLPAGLSLSSGGVLSGTPSAAGSYPVTIIVTDNASNTASVSVTITVVAAPAVTTASPLPDGTQDVPYAVTIGVSGGLAPFTWAVAAGTLPPGFTLAAATGALAGTPPTVTSYSFTIRATDALGNTASRAFTLTVDALVSPPPPPPGGPAPPAAGYPQVIVEAAFYSAAPAAPDGVLILGDPVSGLLGTATLGDGTAWTDITAFVRSGSVTRASSRVQGPLRVYQGGTGSVILDNTDGRFDTDAAGPYAGSILPMVPLRVRAIWNNTEYHLFSGFADTWQETPVSYDAGWSEVTVSGSDGFKALAGITLPPADALGLGELSGARVSRILTDAGWYTDHRRIDAGGSALQATGYGDTALNLLQLAADSEIGQLYIDGSGNVVFRERQATISDLRSITVQAVFGDSPGTADAEGTELACAAIGRANDDTTLANDVQITNAGGILQEATDAASVRKFLFPRTYARSDIILQTDAEALSYAQWVLYLSLGGEDRFDTLDIDPIADPAGLFPQVLGREIGDRIMVYRRPQNSAAVIAKPCFIAGITHALDVIAGTWATTWDLQDASKYVNFLILGDPALGTVSSGNKLAY